MYKKILLQNIDKISKQRDLFLLLTIFTLISNILLIIKIVISDERLVMVPAISQDMWLSNRTVSPSYLEEISIVFLSNLLNISANDIAHKKSIILKYTTSDSGSFNSIQKYFVDAEEEYKRFDLSTYFTIKNMEIDISNLTVIAHGILTSSYGKKGSSAAEESYSIQFEYIGGNLKLKSFARIIQKEE